MQTIVHNRMFSGREDNETVDLFTGIEYTLESGYPFLFLIAIEDKIHETPFRCINGKAVSLRPAQLDIIITDSCFCRTCRRKQPDIMSHRLLFSSGILKFLLGAGKCSK